MPTADRQVGNDKRLNHRLSAAFDVADSLVRLAASHPPVGEIPPVEHKETIERQVEARVARYVYHNEGKLLLPSEAETHKHDNS